MSTQENKQRRTTRSQERDERIKSLEDRAAHQMIVLEKIEKNFTEIELIVDQYKVGVQTLHVMAKTINVIVKYIAPVVGVAIAINHFVIGYFSHK